MNKKVLALFCISGVLALLAYFLHDLIGALNYPGYDWLSQAVSDLTAANAASKDIAGGISNVFGVFSVITGVLACVYFSEKENKLFRLGIYLFAAMNIMSSFGYSLFPLKEAGTTVSSLQNIIHVYVITVGVVILSIASLVLIIIGGFKNNTNKQFSIVAIVTLSLMMIGAIGSQIVPIEYFGLVERFSTYSVAAFTAFIGSYIFYKEIISKNQFSQTS